MDISPSLRNLRKANKDSQQDIADILGIKRTTYASYETGRVSIDINLLQKLSNYYSVTIEDILNGRYVSEADETRNITHIEHKRPRKTIVKDAPGVIIDGQHKILAYDRIILSTLAEVLGHLKKLNVDTLESGLLLKVDAEMEEIANELKQKS